MCVHYVLFLRHVQQQRLNPHIQGIMLVIDPIIEMEASYGVNCYKQQLWFYYHCQMRWKCQKAQNVT